MGDRSADDADEDDGTRAEAVAFDAEPVFPPRLPELNEAKDLAGGPP